MKTINTTKKMADNEKVKTKARKDTSEQRTKQELVHKFIDTYVKPKTLCLGIKDVNVLGELDSRSEQILLLLSEFQVDEEQSYVLLEEDEVGFLYSKDTKIKAKVGKKVADFLVRSFTYNEKLTEYIKEYVVPLLEKLNNEKIITYDVNAIDNKTKLETDKITKFVEKFINDSAVNSIQFPLFVGLYADDYKEQFDFLFCESVQIKKDFANLLYNYLKENHNKIDYKRLGEIDFGAFTGAKLD